MEITDNTLSQINSNYMPTGKPELLNQIAPRIISQFEQQPTGEGIGYKTGLADVDRILGGICDGEFCIVAGRPSMGKTSFALQMIRHNAVVHKIPTLFFSLEMSRDAIAGRILWAEAQANYETVLRGGKQDLPAVREKYETDLCNTPLYLDGTPGTTISHIQIKTENYVRNYGVKIIFIDRLEYIRPTIRGRSRNEEVSEISKGLVYIAKKFNIPVILVVQLNRGVEHREDKIPELSDLRDSGALEEDAVKVLMIYREEYYKRESQKKSIAEILIRKNQNGRTGYCETIFKAETMSFFNLTPEHTMGGEYNP
jgi:replicative DNA helicase